MEFRTKLDFSTRQVKQKNKIIADLSGTTKFGVPFSSIPTGPDLSTTGITSYYVAFNSTFSGNSATTVYNWTYPVMSSGQYQLSALTPSNSATTQNVLSFSSTSTTVIDGNTVNLSYSGISFDITPIVFNDLGSGNYSGTVYTELLNILTAEPLDFTGRTIWVDVSGITRTDKLIISTVGAGPGVTDLGVDAQGNVVDQASDIKLKENINTIQGALEKVLKLRGVTYNWRDKSKGGDALKLGFIAQEVNKVIPELTYINSEYMGVHYKDMPALLVEAIKELYQNKPISNNSYIETETIVAEDNSIDLNYNGNHESSIGGGLTVLNGISNGENTELKTDENGDWVTNVNLIPKGLIIPNYTPQSSTSEGKLGSITYDENYIYIKTKNGWKRSSLESF